MMIMRNKQLEKNKTTKIIILVLFKINKILSIISNKVISIFHNNKLLITNRFKVL